MGSLQRGDEQVTEFAFEVIRSERADTNMAYFLVATVPDGRKFHATSWFEADLDQDLRTMLQRAFVSGFLAGSEGRNELKDG
mgnify:CR=1 FL=1